MNKTIIITTPNGTHPFNLTSETVEGVEKFSVECISPAAESGKFPVVNKLEPVGGWKLSVEGSNHHDKFVVGETSPRGENTGGNPVASARLHIADGSTVVSVGFRFGERQNGNGFALTTTVKRGSGRKGAKPRRTVNAAEL